MFKETHFSKYTIRSLMIHLELMKYLNMRIVRNWENSYEFVIVRVCCSVEKWKVYYYLTHEKTAFWQCDILWFDMETPTQYLINVKVWDFSPDSILRKQTLFIVLESNISICVFDPLYKICMYSKGPSIN